MIELSVALCTPRYWDLFFGWTSHLSEEDSPIKGADVLTLSLLFLKFRLFIFYNANDE